MPAHQTYSISGVEIFSEGKWNGDVYTADHLKEIVSAFGETKAGIPPYLKLGHSGKQKLLQEDGLPAAGWVENVYVSGQKLMADFAHIPKKIYDLIKTKAYRKVSCEIYWNAKVNEKTYPKLLGAVALLGANTPGVMNLNDIMAGYFKSTDFEKLVTFDDEALEIRTLTEKETDNMPAPEKTVKEVELEHSLKSEADKRAAFEKENADLKTNFSALEAKAKEDAKELERLKKFESEQATKAQEDAAKAKKLENENFILGLEKDHLVTPAMKPYVSALIESVGEKKEYSVSLKDGEKKVGAQDLVKELLKLSQKSVSNFTESSINGDKIQADDMSDGDLKEIEEYATKHNLSYSAAAKEVVKQKKG